jgi:hypothetical protein
MPYLNEMTQAERSNDESAGLSAQSSVCSIRVGNSGNQGNCGVVECHPLFRRHVLRGDRLARRGHVNPCRLVDGQNHETPALSNDGERCDSFTLSESFLL